MVTSALSAQETLEVCAPIMESVWMVSMATGSASALRVSMALHVRIVSLDAMESTAPQVRVYL